ncbi:GNAT family N-acetyltransferase [Paenibacillus sp. TAB 01]|uniref:GNAT family N-acetyltransferase n=1 Tax=Paenibacillus sp. TAB 01 TaxID=3368988 RepID=UPI003751E7B3
MDSLEFHTTDVWNEQLWKAAEPVYTGAFPEHGRKSFAIIRNMFDRGLCQLHTADDGQVTKAMALTGIDRRASALLIDYAAVREEERSRGLGRRLIDYLKSWGIANGCRGMVIEVEADETEENLRRIRFWERCGFILTEGVHQYIWVPEPYQAMVFHLQEENRLPEDGEVLFRYITDFHKKAYRSR